MANNRKETNSFEIHADNFGHNLVRWRVAIIKRKALHRKTVRTFSLIRVRITFGDAVSKKRSELFMDGNTENVSTIDGFSKRIFGRNFAIFRQPPLAIMKNIFTLPFALSVWITTFAMLFVFAVVLIFLAWTSNRLKGKKTDYSTAFDTVTVVLGAVCQQGEQRKR